jgi:transposase, IS5 family
MMSGVNLTFRKVMKSIYYLSRLLHGKLLNELYVNYLYDVIKTASSMSFSSYDVARRTAKNTFFTQINTVLNWSALDEEIRRHYHPGKSATGQAAYSGLLLFKMLLTGYWMGGLSDRDVEDMANENLSVMRFLGLQLEDMVPDHSVLSRFRSSLAKSGAFDVLLNSVNQQLEGHGVLVKTGIKIDASITDTPRKPKGKATYEITEDRHEDEVSEDQIQKQESDIKLIKSQQPGVDIEGRYTKKAGKLRYGYKKHIATEEDGLVLSVITTAANEHDSLSMEGLLTKASIEPKSRVLADKAYKSAKHDELLKEMKLKNGIHYKAVRGKKLTKRELLFNKAISRSRYTVERTFGSQVRWFGAGTAKYVGQIKTHGQHVMEAIAYNIKRLPGLLMKIETQKLITAQ